MATCTISDVIQAWARVGVDGDRSPE